MILQVLHEKVLFAVTHGDVAAVAQTDDRAFDFHDMLHVDDIGTMYLQEIFRK